MQKVFRICPVVIDADISHQKTSSARVSRNGYRKLPGNTTTDSRFSSMEQLILGVSVVFPLPYLEPSYPSHFCILWAIYRCLVLCYLFLLHSALLIH
ncbi:hypothetical protein BDV28DRAFT_128422 [Aspergillus coremiiformis]|uniref:Uncharacterized protein n=1 Tax=Aspergillus coremiiformis TaxID=138285 RepID=A0A5N6ZDS5_9EURO|nr:hypothetical protein BDV28DRAFT_128422 [Aspergillus coremiiformis]